MALEDKKNTELKKQRVGSCLHKLRYYKKVQDLTKIHHIAGETILIAVFYNHVYPIYPMSYSRFRYILEEPRLRARIKELEDVRRK